MVVRKNIALLRRFHLLASAFVIAGMTAGLMACAKEQSSVAKSNLESGGAVDPWANIKSFPDAITALAFKRYEPRENGRLFLGVSYTDVTRRSGVTTADSRHVLLTGTINRGGRALLTERSPRPYSDDVVAEFFCLNAQCSEAKILLKKLTGTLAGTAYIRLTEVEGARVLSALPGSVSPRLRSDEPQLQIRQALQRSRMERNASFELMSVAEGTTFFSVHVNNNPLDEGYAEFGGEHFTISGAIKGSGPTRTTVQLSYGHDRSHTTVSTSKSHQADVVIDYRNLAIRMAFADAPAVSAITVGTDILGTQ